MGSCGRLLLQYAEIRFTRSAQCRLPNTARLEVAPRKLQLVVLFAQLAQFTQFAQAKACILLLAQTRALPADPMPAAEFHDCLAPLCLPQNPQNLLFAMTHLRHLPALLSNFREPRQARNSQRQSGLSFWFWVSFWVLGQIMHINWKRFAHERHIVQAADMWHCAFHLVAWLIHASPPGERHSKDNNVCVQNNTDFFLWREFTCLITIWMRSERRSTNGNPDPNHFCEVTAA